MIIIQLDANAKIGKKHVRNDPNYGTPNGRILLDIVERQNLTIVNTMELCKGVITRERITAIKTERSVIDYIIICEGMKKFLEEMIIDEDRVHVLTKRVKRKQTMSNHNILYSKFSIHFDPKPKTVRREFFNLKDRECQAAFLKKTSTTELLSSSFDPNLSFGHNANVFFKNLKGRIQKCFKKIRINKGGKISHKEGNNPIMSMMKLKTELKRFLKNCNCQIGKEIATKRLEEVEKYLNDHCAEKNAETVREYVQGVENDAGNFSQLKLWKLKQKLCPKNPDPPMAKKDRNGNLITSPESLKSLYLKTYQNRLQNREMKNELLDVFFLKEELWSSRMEELRNSKTNPWTVADLRRAISSLKKNKTSDPNGLINEIFMEECAGNDMETTMLLLLNGIKENFQFPEYILRQNISTLFKNKGSRLEMNSARGIFILSTIKKILDNLFILTRFVDIDKNMSNSDIGARKGRNVKDNLFLIYGIINSVIRGNEPSIDIQIYE